MIYKKNNQNSFFLFSYFIHFNNITQIERIQPVLSTQRKQMTMWGDLLLDYTKEMKLSTIIISEIAETEVFWNKKIGKKMPKEEIIKIFDDLESRKNGEWVDPKNKERFTMLWRSITEWSNIIYTWAKNNGQINSVCTFYQLQEDEETEGEEFHHLETDLLIKALQQLEKEGKAQLFQGKETSEMGIKFFAG